MLSWAGVGPGRVPRGSDPSTDRTRRAHEKYSGEAGRVWIAGLPALAASYLDRWQLAIDGRATSGAVALIIPVTCRDGSKAVLKLQPVDDETGGEPAAALQAWAGRGAVRLLEHDPQFWGDAAFEERLDASRETLQNTVEDDLAAATIIAGCWCN